MFNTWIRTDMNRQIRIKSHAEDKTFSFQERTRISSKKWSRWKQLSRIPSDILIEIAHEINLTTNQRLDLLPCIKRTRLCKVQKERLSIRKDVKSRYDGWRYRMRYVMLLLLFFVSGCYGAESGEPLDEIVGSSIIKQSWVGTVTDRSDQTTIQAGQPRYVVLHFDGVEVDSVSGAHFRSIESICKVYWVGGVE